MTQHDRRSHRRAGRAAAALHYLVMAMLGSLCALASGEELPGLDAAARSILGADQGVYVQAADGTVLLARNAATPVHPASVSKVLTTLALLRKFGPQYRFVTTFSGQGRIQGGTLEGDLWVQSDGDPSLVDEDGLLVAERLNELGVRRVAGQLRVRGPLTFDWHDDADGAHLRQVLSGIAPSAAWAAVQSTGTAATPPEIQFAGSLSGTTAGAVDGPPNRQTLVAYRSQPLLALVKSLNDFSNNIVNQLADAVGGAGAVQSVARSAVPPAMRAEITLGDGAGADPRNRLSPRAAVTLLRALQQQLAATGHALPDILPVAGIDDGTLRERLNAPAQAGRVVGKTGTYGDYGASALIGAIPTGERGTVYFAILDHGVPVPEARRRQDRFVGALLTRLHSLRWNYQRDARPAVARAEVSTLPERLPGAPK